MAWLLSINKAWFAGVVAFVSQYIVLPFFGFPITETMQAAIVSVLVFAAAWFIPNVTTDKK